MISSLILFFLGFVYSYFFYKDSQKTYEITVGSEGRRGKIRYFYIWNSGKNTIFKEDILSEFKSLEITFKEDYLIEFAKITDKTSPYFKVDLLQNYKDIKIDFDFLRPDEGFTLMIKSKFDKSSVSYWDLQIKQKKDVLTFPDTIKARGANSNLYLLNNLLSYASLSFFVITSLFVGEIDFTNLEGGFEYFNAIIPLIFLGFLVYMTPTMFRRIKASRPPIELELHFIEQNKEEQKLKNVFKYLIKKVQKKINTLRM